jgi:hypothetical protein
MKKNYPLLLLTAFLVSSTFVIAVENFFVAIKILKEYPVIKLQK